MAEELVYTERVSGKRTEALFVGLALLFFSLFVRRAIVRGLGKLAAVFFFLAGFFFFYVVNYRTLVIELSAKSLELSFGVFAWEVPLENIEDAHLDDIPLFMRYGGAGIHFMNIGHRYRASFNFLEHPRVVIALKEKVGPVRDISFSSRQPDDLLRLIHEAISADN